MIRSDFNQTVAINGVTVYVSDMSIRESISEVISQIDFAVKSDVNSAAAIAELDLSSEVVITQTASGSTITWRGTIEDVSRERRESSDYYMIQCAGEAEKLSRFRFTYLFDGLTASEIIIDAMARFGQNTGITTNGVEENTQDIGAIVSREDTIFDIIDRVAQRSDWSWIVEDGDLKFFDPQSRPAPFELKSGENIASNSLSLKRNLAEVRNVIKSEAYQYQNVLISKTIPGCSQSVYGQKFNADIWEFSGEGEITSPEELTPQFRQDNELPAIRLDVDLFSGRVSFSQPVFIESSSIDSDKQSIDIRVQYSVRRKLLVEKRNVSSIDLYGERHGVLQPSNGGDDVETTFKKLQSEIDLKAFPLVTGSCQTVDFGLRPGMWVSITPFGQIQPTSVRVTSVRHTVNGNDLQIDLDFSTRSYTGVDAVPEIVQRLENIEKRGIDPRSITGKLIRETGSVVEVSDTSSSIEISDQVDIVIATTARISGGGGAVFTSFGFEGVAGLNFTGGGEFSAVRFALGSGTFNGTGGGELTFANSELKIFTESASIKGGGQNGFFSGEIIDGSRETETGGVIRATEDGTIRVVE